MAIEGFVQGCKYRYVGEKIHTLAEGNNREDILSVMDGEPHCVKQSSSHLVIWKDSHGTVCDYRGYMDGFVPVRVATDDEAFDFVFNGMNSAYLSETLRAKEP